MNGSWKIRPHNGSNKDKNIETKWANTKMKFVNSDRLTIESTNNAKIFPKNTNPQSILTKS